VKKGLFLYSPGFHSNSLVIRDMNLIYLNTSHMETISISKLKAHLSSELKKVQNGTRIVVLDHKHPVAELIPAGKEELFLYEASQIYSCNPLLPITDKDPLGDLEKDCSGR
jgi:antitoxin (DNA-binding transcriptional repressor) of toxin-antitoxin stability system